MEDADSRKKNRGNTIVVFLIVLVLKNDRA